MTNALNGTPPPVMVQAVPFVFRDRYEWVEAPEDTGFGGFAAEVRVNLPNGEMRAFLDEIRDIEMARIAVFSVHEAEQRKLLGKRDAMAVDDLKGREANLKDYEVMLRRHMDERHAIDVRTYDLVAPHIRDWNAYESVDGGEAVKILPPVVGGAASFDAIDNAMTAWLVGTVATAYRTGKGVRRSSLLPADTPEPSPEQSSGPQVVSET